MLLNRYLNISKIYSKTNLEEDELIKKINDTIEKQTKIEVTSKLDTDSLSKATFYYNFVTYSMLARKCLYYMFNFI